jgi:hypothetical protein
MVRPTPSLYCYHSETIRVHAVSVHCNADFEMFMQDLEVPSPAHASLPHHKLTVMLVRSRYYGAYI